MLFDKSKYNKKPDLFRTSLVNFFYLPEMTILPLKEISEVKITSPVLLICVIRYCHCCCSYNVYFNTCIICDLTNHINCYIPNTTNCYCGLEY
ncbi:hypothetical protein [Salmonella phage SD-6_S16]|nr:hypothetical protein [Salmonella phage SD-6_S16]